MRGYTCVCVCVSIDLPSHPTTRKETSPAHCIVGVGALKDLVNEMNHADPVQGFTKHRKISNSFRDNVLYDIFKQALAMLRRVASKELAIPDPSQVEDGRGGE